MNTETISIVTAATILLVGCSKQSSSSGTASAPPTEQNSAESAATAANVTGTWKLMAPANPDGQIPDITFTLKLEGKTLTGTRTTGIGKTTILTNGVITGDEVSFETPRHEASYPKGKVSYEAYSGTLSGDTIKGTINIYINDKVFNSQTWEAKRVEE
jgi:hypothetical protein